MSTRRNLRRCINKNYFKNIFFSQVISTICSSTDNWSDSRRSWTHSSSSFLFLFFFRHFLKKNSSLARYIKPRLSFRAPSINVFIRYSFIYLLTYLFIYYLFIIYLLLIYQFIHLFITTEIKHTDTSPYRSNFNKLFVPLLKKLN